jgi:hypothetical protein
VPREPLTHLSLRAHHCALSRKGRGHERQQRCPARATNLRVYQMRAGATSLFRGCSLQGMVQLPRVRRIEPANSLHGDVVEWPHAAACVVV